MIRRVQDIGFELELQVLPYAERALDVEIQVVAAHAPRIQGCYARGVAWNVQIRTIADVDKLTRLSTVLGARVARPGRARSMHNEGVGIQVLHLGIRRSRSEAVGMSVAAVDSVCLSW